MAPPPPVMEEGDGPEALGEPALQQNSFGNGMAPRRDPKPTPPKPAAQPWADDREAEPRAGVPRRMGGLRGYSKWIQ